MRNKPMWHASALQSMCTPCKLCESKQLNGRKGWSRNDRPQPTWICFIVSHTTYALYDESAMQAISKLPILFICVSSQLNMELVNRLQYCGLWCVCASNVNRHLFVIKNREIFSIPPPPLGASTVLSLSIGFHWHPQTLLIPIRFFRRHRLLPATLATFHSFRRNNFRRMEREKLKNELNCRTSLSLWFTFLRITFDWFMCSD